VSLGEDRLESGQSFECGEVNFVDFLKCRPNRLVDVKVTSGKDRMRVKRFSKDRK